MIWNKYGDIQLERACHQAWGWNNVAGVSEPPPSISPNTPAIGKINDIHGSLETDDLWENILMWKRTGDIGFYQRASTWADWYSDSVAGRGFLPEAIVAGEFEEQRGGCHVFGWGLIDWQEIKDQEALRTGTAFSNRWIDAADAIGQRVYNSFFSLQSDGSNIWKDGFKNGFYGLRGPGRWLRLASRLSDYYSGGRNQDPTKSAYYRTLADAEWAKLRDVGDHNAPAPNGYGWTERTISGIDFGFWRSTDPFSWSGPISNGALSTLEFSILGEGLWDYYQLTRDPEVRRRLILIARWARLYGIDPATQHTGHWIVVDLGGPNQFFHTGLGSGIPLQPFYTTMFTNILVHGYYLTGDVALIEEAKRHWDRASRATISDPYPYTNRKPDNVVGQFMNAPAPQEAGSLFFISDGYATQMCELFYAYPKSCVSHITNSAYQNLVNALFAEHDIRSDPQWGAEESPDIAPDSFINNWGSACIDTHRGKYVTPGIGGHSQRFYSEVSEFDCYNGGLWGWSQPAYRPFLKFSACEANPTKIFPDFVQGGRTYSGQPFSTHTYGTVHYDPVNRAIFKAQGAAYTNGSAGMPWQLRFKPDTSKWERQVPPAFIGNSVAGAWQLSSSGFIFYDASRGLRRYDWATNGDVPAGPGTPLSLAHTACIALDRYFVLIGPSQATIQNGWSSPLEMEMRTFDLVNGALVKQSILSGVGPTGFPALDYLPGLDKVMLWVGGGNFKAVDYLTGAVSDVVLPIAPSTPMPGPVWENTPGRNVTSGFNNRMRAIEPDKLVFLRGVQDPMFVFSFKTALIPGPDPEPSSPPDPPDPPDPIPPGGDMFAVILECESMPIKTVGGPSDPGWLLWSNGYCAQSVTFPQAGRHRFTLRAYGQPAQNIGPIAEIRIDQVPIAAKSIGNGWGSYIYEADIVAGPHEVAVAFTNDFYSQTEDRNLYVDKIVIDQLTTTTPPPTNLAPVVNAGPDQTITLPAKATLAATVTDDNLPNPPAMTYQWSGPAGVTFSAPTALNTQATFSAPGTFTLVLTASDGSLSAFDNVVVTVLPVVPTQKPLIGAVKASGTLTDAAGAVKNVDIDQTIRG